MRRLALLAFAALGAACTSDDRLDPACEPSLHAVSGTLSGSAVVDVIVKLKGSGLATTRVTKTDAAGRYAFSGVADGAYTVKAMALGHAFTPATTSVTVACADVAGRDFVGEQTSGPSLRGWVEGTILGGAEVSATGAASASTTTDVFGDFTLDPLPAGDYTVTASAAGASFVPDRYELTWSGVDLGGLWFRSTPPSSPFTVHVAGDAASGVAAGSYAGSNGSHPNPDVAVYDPANDLWTIGMRFDPPPYTGIGGFVSYSGAPAVGAYTEASAGLRNTYGLCWSAASVPGGNTDQSWVATSFTLVLAEVGPGAPTNVHGASSLSYVTDYPIHGTFHAVCTPTPTSAAQGTVTIDVAF